MFLGAGVQSCDKKINPAFVHIGFHTRPDIILIFSLLRCANLRRLAVYESQYENRHALTYTYPFDCTFGS
jgi:hypothetical protein